MEKHLIVIIVDAMVHEDLALLSKLPNTGRLLENGSLVRSVTTIYPSLTHPVHATLMSGCAAGKTGIYNNEIFEPGKKVLPWNNYLCQMRCDTIFHAAHRAGLTTAACRWPMTGGGFDVIDYLVPEVMDTEMAEEPDLEKLYARVCTPELFEHVVRPNIPVLDLHQRYPKYEEFSQRCAREIIRRYRPNLLLTHPGQVDETRHDTGLFGPAVDDALRLTDEWIGGLMQAVRDAGIEESTSFAVVSDHGHLEWVRDVALNVLFAEKGLLRADENGSLAGWDVYAKSSGLSAQIYVRERSREPEVFAMLKEMAETGLYGFGEVLEREEMRRRYGLYGDFSFAVETDGYSHFTDDWSGPAVRSKCTREYGVHHSSHGHMPEKGPQPVMILSGPAFRSGAVLEHASVLDEAPTFAAALGLSLPDADGKPITELLSGC